LSWGVTLTPHGGVSTIGKQENADAAGAGSALQGGYKAAARRGGPDSKAHRGGQTVEATNRIMEVEHA
jgi:hypothetical protein